MRARHILGGLLAAALLSSTAIAQTNAPAPAPAPTATNVAPKGGEWRASKVIGVNIYNEQNEKLGDISEIILDPAGRVVGYVVGVGGFLGMGEHNIMVEPGKIKFVNEPLRSTTSSNNPRSTTPNNPPANAPSTTSSNNPPANTTMNTRNVSNTKDWYPDHGILNATKDQLKALPQFKY